MLLAQRDGSWPRLKTCRNPHCPCAFHDASRNNSRVWHDVRSCGNVANLRASRARRRPHPDGLTRAPDRDLGGCGATRGGGGVGGVIEGFGTIAAVIALGALLAQLGVVDDRARVVLSRLSFFVASPALMVTVLGDTDVDERAVEEPRRHRWPACSSRVVLYVLAARLVWRRDLAETVIGSLCAAYVNAGNLGLPIAAYVLGDAALVAPTLLLQLLVLQPLALALLDHATSDAAVLGRPGDGPRR